METEGFSIPKNLEVLPLGENGEMEIVPASAANIPCSSRLPCGLPPILPDTETLIKSYLDNMGKLPIFDSDNVQRFIRREPNIHSLFPIDICPLQTTLKVKRDMTTGRLLGFSEEVKDILQETTKTSTSLKRAPGPPEAGVRGSNSGFPFWPGGMDDPLEKIIQREPITTSLFDGEYLCAPPGFKNGMSFERKDHSRLMEKAVPPQKIYLSDVLTLEEPISLEPFKETENPFSVDEIKLEELHIKSDTKKPEISEDEDDVLKIDTLPVLNISKMNEEKYQKSSVHYEWAVEENVSTPVENFNTQIPDMAFKWPFELDTFQKRAILHLENHESVFVAAHTSAGKTVVAEYAIALAKKHMTRVIYTSPIKALSNQKFREFKISFEDVGLITGDIQINQTAFCLIMTTEILRSMLYHGSDVVRELEWVIFDEVHYINDAERGVVWEEVLIMLPSHVNLILLSATVPNTAELAEWLGRIKKRKIYVISTLKRPVPLEFYLYTGSVGKTQDDRFLLVDATSQFLTTGYNKALDSKKDKEGKTKRMTGPKGSRYNVSLQQEKNIYIGLIGHLKKEDLLPVVCFTLSRKRCDEHAKMLQSKDLCTQKEKSEIVAFVNRSVSKLKDVDKDLPQVRSMTEILSCGYGVHHSGILPILKEIVEMLFQRGLVKVLFATETFAMGVNMPARTVVFDSIRKHDGTGFRDLRPSEFIQMAGRAGRRGLDKTGTVIVLCKGDIPELRDLHQMMLGKPQKLESKFRLTYSMILNLLKVKSFRVQDVMKRSFGESSNQKHLARNQDLLTQAHDKLTKLSKPDCSLCSDIEQYYKAIHQLEEVQKKVMPKVCVYAMNAKVLSAGRIVAVQVEGRKNVPGVLLSVDNYNCCKVLIISTKQQEKDASKNHESKLRKKSADSSGATPWSKSLFFTNENYPEIYTVTFEDFQTVSNKTLRIDADKIFKDWSKMRSYINLPPGQFISATFQELCAYCEARRDGLTSVNLNFTKDMQLMEDLQYMERLESSLEKFNCMQCPLFKEHFSQMSELMNAEDDVTKYQFLVSEESLLLHSEYESRKKILQNLGYIDATDTPTLKGSVAREMNNHELLTTELLLKYVFGDCSPEEIAAILSCMVFQQRCDESELNLPDNLMKKVIEVKQTAEEIDQEQRYCEIYEPDFVEQYRFYLVNIVYEWAKGTSFSEIMKHTDVQEGIIVRCIQRLSELLKDVKNGAQLVGDPTLAKKMDDASRLIKRDIVFAASLYTQ